VITAPGPLLLRAATPQEWLATHLEARQSAHDDPAAGQPRWVGVADLLADGAAPLRAAHARLVAAGGTPPAAAAKWLVGWFAGGLADASGYLLAAASAALLVPAGATRFRLHPGGWPERTDPGTAAVAVAESHPWAGRPGVRVVRDDRAVAALAVDALAPAVEPVVAACRTLARVGTSGLWTEVADRFGLAVLHELDLPVDPAVVDRLQEALHTPGRPWRRAPELRVAHGPDGPAYLGRKGGCCLAYRCPPGPALDLDALDERLRTWYTRFPLDDGPRYCSTCSLRDLAGCEERQRFWTAQERAARGG
jgi:hypothetical protein